jgi:hypothetical protein
MIDIQKRHDELYNVWCHADLVLRRDDLMNYSSDWIVIGTATSFNRAMALANDFLVQGDEA